MHCTESTPGLRVAGAVRMLATSAAVITSQGLAEALPCAAALSVVLAPAACAVDAPFAQAARRQSEMLAGLSVHSWGASFSVVEIPLGIDRLFRERSGCGTCRVRTMAAPWSPLLQATATASHGIAPPFPLHCETTRGSGRATFPRCPAPCRRWTSASLPAGPRRCASRSG